MLTLTDARQHLGIDTEDDALVNANVQRALSAAVQTVLGAVGDDFETYIPADPRFDELVLHYLQEIYENRGTTSARAANAAQAWVFSVEEQLRLALRRAKRAASEEAGS